MTMPDPCMFSLSLVAHMMILLLQHAFTVDGGPYSPRVALLHACMMYLAFLTKIGDNMLIARMCRWKLATPLHFS